VLTWIYFLVKMPPTVACLKVISIWSQSLKGGLVNTVTASLKFYYWTNQWRLVCRHCGAAAPLFSRWISFL